MVGASAPEPDVRLQPLLRERRAVGNQRPSSVSMPTGALSCLVVKSLLFVINTLVNSSNAKAGAEEGGPCGGWGATSSQVKLSLLMVIVQINFSRGGHKMVL